MHVKIIEPSHYFPNGTLCRFPKLWVTGLTAIYLAALTPAEDEEIDLVAKLMTVSVTNLRIQDI